MTPFDQTSGKLHFAAASLLVIFAAQLLKWQNPAAVCADVLQFLRLGAGSQFATQEQPLPTH